VKRRARHQRGEALHELLRGHDDVGRAVAIGALQLQYDLAFAIAAKPLVGERRARDGPAQPFEFFTLLAGDAYGGVQGLTPMLFT